MAIKTNLSNKQYESWGKYPKAEASSVKPIYWRDTPLRLDKLGKSVLPYAWGRSYGDSCLNDGGILLDTTALSRFMAFDEEKGLLRCEAGVTLDACLRLIVPRGWFLPVTPGTKYVSVAGAIANDIHGKNHYKEGTFGCHVTRFELLRSNGERFICSPSENIDLFCATIGGLGLTGLILWAEFQLKPIKNAYIDMERIKFSSLDEFFAISRASHDDYEYTVAWLDCLTQGKQFGRGWIARGNHAQGEHSLQVHKEPLLMVPFNLPSFALNRLTMKILNNFMYHIYQVPKNVKKAVHYEPFFYPLDMIKNWNRIYGAPGFMQYQFVLPPNDDNHRILRQIIQRIADSGQTFLNVFKEFGNRRSPGTLSFPREGVTLALDFPNNGTRTLQLLTELDHLVREANGVLYPAKDGRMSAPDFQRFYPQWEAFAAHVDPHFSSSFWRRVTE